MYYNTIKIYKERAIKQLPGQYTIMQWLCSVFQYLLKSYQPFRAYSNAFPSLGAFPNPFQMEWYLFWTPTMVAYSHSALFFVLYFIYMGMYSIYFISWNFSQK